ncbi:MAG: lactonase family protein [Erysipelotrichaceae bacterium]|nr:lactonase family protein [Erysipelotrichaceae bacterium]
MKRLYFVASWQQGENEGITKIEYDKQTDTLFSRELIGSVKRSSYFARRGDCLFVLTEAQMHVPNGGCVTSYKIEDDKPILLNRTEYFDSGVTHLNISKDGKHLYASGYGTGTLFVIDVDKDGYLSNARVAYKNIGSSINKLRQESSHMHFTTPAPDNGYICTCDLGTDEILVFNANEENGDVIKVSSLKTSLGYGPRHMVFSKDGKYAYVLCEMNYHLLIYAYEGTGDLEFINDIELYPEAPADKRSCSAIRISQDGKTLFTANRGEGYNSLDAWDLSDPENPVLCDRFTDVYFPRDFAILEDNYLAVCNQLANQLQFVKFENGHFTETGKIEGILMPVSVVEW